MSVLRLAIVDPANESREQLRNMLLGVETVWLEAECSRYEFFLDVAAQSTPDVTLVTLDSDPDQALELIKVLVHTYPKMHVLAVSSRTDGPFILDVLRLGAKDFVNLPVSYEQMLGALQRMSPSSDRQPCRVYAFCGARGGVGSTSLAVNFGCILAANENNSVALVDLDLAMGDADVCIDVVPDYTLVDVAQNIDRIDLQLLKRSLSKHSSGLYLLPHPVQIEDAAFVQAEHVTRVLNLMKMTFTHIVLDLSKGYQPIDMAALELADFILLVTQLDVSNLRNVVRLMMLLSERESMADKVRVIANRVGSDENEIGTSRAEETIGREIFCRVPNDSRTMMAARNNGVPLIEHAPRSKLYTSILAMTESIVGMNGQRALAPEPKKKGWFR